MHVALCTWSVSVLHAAGPDTKYRAPRTEWGQADMQGVWNFSSDAPLERPAAFADKKFFTREELAQQVAGKRKALSTVAKFAPVEDVAVDWLDYKAHIENLRTSLITYPENGRIPKLIEGVRRVPGVDDFIAALNDTNGTAPPGLLAAFGGGKKDGVEDLGFAERCLGGSGSPLMPGFDGNHVQIIQSKDHVVLLTETFHKARIVPLDARPNLRLRTWHGDSRGHWEGDTLVVVTSNFNGRTQSFAGAGRSHEKTVTERFTRVAPGVLEYEATIVDPKTFEDKVVVSIPMAKVDARLYEAACHEGNYSLPMTLAGARKAEQEAAAK